MVDRIDSYTSDMMKKLDRMLADIKSFHVLIRKSRGEHEARGRITLLLWCMAVLLVHHTCQS